MGYVGKDVELVNLWTYATKTPEYREEVTKKQRAMLVEQGTDPDVSLFVQDVAEPVAEAVQPVGAWLDRWKIPLSIGIVVSGGLLLLGYSGMGEPIGAYAAKKIGEK